MYKVIKIDNLDREDISDVLIKDNLSEDEANELAKSLNTESISLYEEYYYIVKLQEYKLWDSSNL